MFKSIFAVCCVLTLATLSGTVRASGYGEYVASVDRAIEAGDSAAAIDLMCDWTKGDPAEYGKEHREEMFAAYDRWQAFQRARYLAVFQPPARVESYFTAGMSWEMWSFMGAAFGGLHGTDAGEQYNDSLLTITRSPEMVVVDLDRDGTPEMIYDGQTPQFTSAVTAVHDRSSDGTRQQWLAAPVGADPRTAAAIWLYRDGPAISVIVRPAGGSPSGRSWCFGRGL